MTREEEIRILQTAFEILDRMVKWYHGTSHDFKIGENDIKALEVAKIAIEALQTEPCEDAIHREREQAYMQGYEDASKSFRREYSEDCISRQAVLDAIEKNCIWENEYNLTSSRIKSAVEKLPSVQPKPKTGYISIADVMSVFDDFMCGDVDEDGTETFLEMLKDKAESEDKE